MRRNDERSKRDLFGQEIQLSAKVVERQDASPFTAARSENSVLFSLDQLEKPRLPEAVASREPVRTKADSGLIDLNALMSDQPLDAKSVRPAPLSEPPLGAFTREMDSTPPAALDIAPAFRPKNRSKLIAAASALGVALLVTVGVVAANREDARVEAAAKAAAAKPPPPATALVAEPPPAAPTPAAETKATNPADTAAASEASTKRASKGHHGRKAGKAKASTAVASTAPAAPKKAADPCGCKGDLMCNIKCSSK